MNPELKRYLFVEQPIGAFVVNFLLNALIAWGLCRGMTTVPLWGETSVAGDTIATSFVLPFVSVLIATLLVRRDVRRSCDRVLLGAVAAIMNSRKPTSPTRCRRTLARLSGRSRASKSSRVGGER